MGYKLYVYDINLLVKNDLKIKTLNPSLLFSETASRLQKRNVSFIIPNTEYGKKRVMVQSQLLDGKLLLLRPFKTTPVILCLHVQSASIKQSCIWVV